MGKEPNFNHLSPFQAPLIKKPQPSPIKKKPWFERKNVDPKVIISLDIFLLSLSLPVCQSVWKKLLFQKFKVKISNAKMTIFCNSSTWFRFLFFTWWPRANNLKEVSVTAYSFWISVRIAWNPRTTTTYQQLKPVVPSSTVWYNCRNVYQLSSFLYGAIVFIMN